MPHRDGAVLDHTKHSRRKTDVMILNAKMRTLIIVMYAALLGVCIYTPLWLYSCFIGLMSVEYGMLSNEHFRQTEKMSKKNSDISAQRRLLGLSAFNNMILTIISISVMFLFSIHAPNTLGYTPDYTNYNDPIVLLFIVMKIGVVMAIVDRIHNFFNMRLFWKFEYKEPPITKAFSWMFARFVD